MNYQQMIDEYQRRTDVIVRHDVNGEWVLDAPDWEEHYDTFEAMMRDIEYNLEQMAEMEAAWREGKFL